MGEYFVDLLDKQIVVTFTPGNTLNVKYDPAFPPLYYE